MTNVQKKLLAVSFCLFLSKSSFAGLFEYSKNIYGLESAACQNEATELAEKISLATKGTVQAAYCAPLLKTGFDIRILIELPSEPEIEMAVFGYRVISYQYPGQKGPINKRYSVISDAGTYIQLNDCLKVLPTYEAIFKSETGLVATSAQCARQSDSRYIAQVDAFGRGSRHLFELNLSLGSSASSMDSLVDIKNYLASVGMTSVTSAPPSSSIQIKYFAENEVVMSAFDFDQKNAFLNAKECAEALQVVRPTLSQLVAAKLVSLQCGQGILGGSKEAALMSAVFDATQLNQKFPSLQIFSIGQFGSYGECQAQISKKADSYCSAHRDINGQFNGYSLNLIRLKN